MKDIFTAGIDIGSTTAKVVIYDPSGKMIFNQYRRHKAKTEEITLDILRDAAAELGNIKLDIAITGSAGMGVAEMFELPFVQEVVASAEMIKQNYPETKTFIEIGGEDSKIIFFDDNFRPDIRMNGSCAGGTGAFIDQMAVLLNVSVSEFNALSEKSDSIYPIASRCGVFAKTDIQALLSRDVSKENIAASVFHSVALQVIGGLSRGRDIKSRILTGGGPLTFYSGLRKAFINVLDLNNPDDFIFPDHPELIPAMGAALIKRDKPYIISIKDILLISEKKRKNKNAGSTKRLPLLFENINEYETWEKNHSKDQVKKIPVKDTKGIDLFLGIDSGSTTTKLVLADKDGNFVTGHYESNNGNPIAGVKNGLKILKEKFDKEGFLPKIVRTAATGYGEDLIRAAFGLDEGVVETMAHYQAARRFEKDVSFILDIGGQDMKAIYIQDNTVSDIQINEACSSGCGSFIETFARSLGYSVEDFSRIACQKNIPFDLGTRCTVFMNSKVKQALREGAAISDISAGLAYSVIKNSLYKVLKIRDTQVLGEKIIVQGGTFKNSAVLRAFELLLQKEVIRPDIPELMGAYGAALTARTSYFEKSHKSTAFPGVENPDISVDFFKKEIECKGCMNNCRVMKLTFENGNSFFTGNRCERYFSNSPDCEYKGENLIEEKLKLLFDRETEPKQTPLCTFGIPRCLNIYENFPFWSAFLVECGFKVVLSSKSSFSLSESGAPTVMSENICFPAKIAHGHIIDLIKKGVDRIFFPIVVYEKSEYHDALNSFNCPVVTGYPDVLKSAINPFGKYKIPFDSPAISFRDKSLLKKQLHLYFKKLGVDFPTVSRAVDKGIISYKEFKSTLREKGAALIARAKKEGRYVVIAAGRPYHIDPFINHGIPELLSGMGVDVLSEDAIPLDNINSLDAVGVLTQWNYINRLYAAANWIGEKPLIHMVHLTSFGCGPDAVAADEVREILTRSNKIYTMIKMDEISNLGATRIRLRSMLSAINEKKEIYSNPVKIKDRKKRIFLAEDKKRTLIAPYFSPFYSSLIPAAFRPLGYKVDVLPPQDKASIEFGLKHINNDMCYPAILVAGDIVKAFKSGKYDSSNTSVILIQTGGQCRASAYTSLIRKGLDGADLGDVPIIAISNDELNPQPGFVINKMELFKRLGLGVIFSDPLARMYLSILPREKIKGTSKALHQKYLVKMEKGIENADYNYLLSVLEEAVRDFNQVVITSKEVSKIGVVGEIFVKYNFFSNGSLIEWLSENGVEVQLPSLQNFFAQRFVNEAYDQKMFFKQSIVDNIKNRLADIYTKYHLKRIDRIMQGFRFYEKPFSLKEIAESAGDVVNLANQFGEGWLLTAEMIAMLKEGVGNIICLQPFGCISNHITGRGLEKSLKEIYPHLNLLSIDLDAGASEVNILNRLHFMLVAAKEELKTQKKTEIEKTENRRFFIPRILPVDRNIFPDSVSHEVEKWKSWVSGLGLWKKAGDFIRGQENNNYRN